MAVKFTRNYNKSSSSSKSSSNTFSNRTNDFDSKVIYAGDGYSFGDGTSRNTSRNKSRSISSSDSNSTSFSFSIGLDSIVSILYRFSMLIFVGSYIFSGVWDNKLLETEEKVNVKDYLYEVTDGQLNLNYDYNISYINYDWDYKISKLNGFRNIFDVDSFIYYTESVEFKISYDFNPNLYTSQEIIDYHNKTGRLYGDLIALYSDNSYILELINDGLLSPAYYSYSTGLFSEDMAFTYLGITDKYYEMYDINYSPLLSNYLLSTDDLLSYKVFIMDKENFWLNNVFKWVLAPVSIVTNIFYDFGVLINFIVSW